MRIADYVNDSVVDGPGLRFALFLQGCDFCCEGCHNKGTWDKNGGRKAAADEIFELIKKNPLLCGVTFSGGEPFLQADALLPLAKMIKESNLELAIYTGFTFEELLAQNSNMLSLLSLSDILIDGRFILKERTLNIKFKGSANQRILDIQKSLAQNKAVITDDDRWVTQERNSNL